MKTKVNLLSLLLACFISITACGNPGAKSEKITDNNNPDEKVTKPENKIEQTIFNFEEFPTGQLPAGWSQYYTGNGGTDWKVVDDNGNKVMAQLYSDNPNGHFNVAVIDNLTAKDLTLTVRLKGVTGNHDQGGGFVWRFIDKNNYYIVRANPLENNVVLYKMENGKRTDLPLVDKGRTYGVDVPPLGNDWINLKLIVKGDLFTVYLNDKELFKVQDSTFTEAGKVGFWTKADAVTYFDDFEIIIQ
jgi:hypothetical protein